MRYLILLMCLALGLNAADTAMAAAAKGKGKKNDADVSKTADVEKAIQGVYEKANRNHSETLSKAEFRKAQGMLDTMIADLARRGVIGQGPAWGKGGEVKPAVNPLTPASADLSKSNKVTEAEFSIYAHTVVAEAEQKMQQAKAAQMQKAAAGRNRPPYMPARRGAAAGS
jgi:hypothetical protein